MEDLCTAVDPVLSVGLPRSKNITLFLHGFDRDLTCSGVDVPVLASLPFLGLKGAVLESTASLSLPFLRMGLSEGVFVRDGRVA